MPSKFHRDIGRPTTDTPAIIAERVRYRAACERANRETTERWPVLSADNVKAALDWQEARIKELLK
jgi:hypothetical protein